MADLYWDKALYIISRYIRAALSASRKEHLLGTTLMKEKDNSGVCGLGECDFSFLSNIIIYRYNAFFMRLHGAMMGVANCRSLLLGNNFFFLFLNV